MLLSRYWWRPCLVYLDYIIIFSETESEHLKHLDAVLAVLKDAGLCLKLNKCRFFTQAVDYLCHIAHPGKLEVASKNTDAIVGFKEPSTKTELRSFFRLCNVYRRFVPNISRVAALLKNLLKKEVPFTLSSFDDEKRQAFQTIKDALVNGPSLLFHALVFPIRWT